MVVLFTLLFFFPQLLQAIGIRNHVPVEISSRCQTLAADIHTFPIELQKEHDARFSALLICKPGFKLWFWQSLDDKALTQLEHSVAQSRQVLLRRQRERYIATRCAFAILLLAVITKIRTTIARKWRQFRRNPALFIIKNFITPLCATASELCIFMQILGVIWSIASTLCAVMCTAGLSIYFFYTAWNIVFFVQTFPLVFFAWIYAQFLMITYIAEGGFVRLQDPDFPFQNILGAEEEREAQDLVNAVVPSCIAFF
jgi:hypothetical protein